jgi:predicted negative regulator of RcsB-dependent stress response
MFELKPLSPEGVKQALEKAERYRLLNEPAEAESICHDVLMIEPYNQEALVTLLLALTDRFSKGYALGATQAQEVAARLTDEYQQHYYSGIINERRGKALLNRGVPGSAYDAYEWLREAMHDYERAETLRPAGNEDAILRWNACARIIMHNHLVPRPKEVEVHFGE